jgi:hypothetical protein
VSAFAPMQLPAGSISGPVAHRPVERILAVPGPWAAGPAAGKA